MFWSFLRRQSHWSFNMQTEKIKGFSLWNNTFYQLWEIMRLSMYIIYIILIWYTLIFYMCRLYYNLRAGGGLRNAGWETLRAWKELGFTSVSGRSKFPSHSCGLKSVAFLHTARGGRWCGRRREAPSPSSSSSATRFLHQDTELVRIPECGLISTVWIGFQLSSLPDPPNEGSFLSAGFPSVSILFWHMVRSKPFYFYFKAFKHAGWTGMSFSRCWLN